MILKERIDVHGHYFPPEYERMLIRHKIDRLDGAPKPRWNENLQLSIMDELNIVSSVLSVSSPHIHMGDKKEAVETARACNEYGIELKQKYPTVVVLHPANPRAIPNGVCEQLPSAIMEYFFDTTRAVTMGDLSLMYYDLAGISLPKQTGLLRMITDDTHLLYGSDSPPLLHELFAGSLQKLWIHYCEMR